MNNIPHATKQALEGMTVVDVNGDKIGTVIDHDEADQYIVVEKGAFFTKDLYIPYNAITGVDDQGVHLNVAKGDFNDKVWQQPPQASSTPTASTIGAAGAAGAAGTDTTTIDQRDVTMAATTTNVAPQNTVATDAEDVRVPVMEEELVAGKREEEIGRVRLHKEVVQEQESVPVTLQREEVTVERVPVNQDVDPNALGDAFSKGDIDVPVMGEEAVVSKQAREVEEVRLHKQEITEQEQIGGTVRRERVVVDGADVDQTAPGSTGTSASDRIR